MRPTAILLALAALALSTDAHSAAPPVITVGGDLVEIGMFSDGPVTCYVAEGRTTAISCVRRGADHAD